MANREPIKWVTINGKHVPIYEDREEGLGAEWLDWSGSYGDTFNPNVDEEKRVREYLGILRDNGIVPEDVDIEEVRRYLIHYGEYGIDEWRKNTPYGEKLEALAKFAGGAMDYGYGNNKRGFDEKYKLSEMIDDTKALHLNTDVPMYRGVRTSQKEIDLLQMMYQSKLPINMKGPSSWSANEYMADKFTKATLAPTGDIRLVYKDVTKGEHNAIPYPFTGQHEAIYSKHNEFNILSMTQDKYDRWVVEVERSNHGKRRTN